MSKTVVWNLWRLMATSWFHGEGTNIATTLSFILQMGAQPLILRVVGQEAINMVRQDHICHTVLPFKTLITYLKHLHPLPASVSILVFTLCSFRRRIDLAVCVIVAIWEEC